MTEIPEHLLKRSKERRSAIGGGDAPAEESAPAGEVEAAPAAAPVAPAAAAAAVPEPAPVPEPVRPEVAAALSRRKIPYWAIPVLAALPLWAYVYQATLEPAPTGELTPLEAGGAVYVSAACARAATAPAAGSASVPGFEGVLETWPDFRDHMMWVRLGNGAGSSSRASRSTAPTTRRPTTAPCPPTRASPTRSWRRSCSTSESQFGGMEESGEEYEQLLAIAEGDLTFADAGLGPQSEAIGIAEDELAAG